MKKTISLILTAALLLTALVLPVSAAYTDTENHWAKDSIDRATELGYFVGTGDGLFNPDGNMTRGMFVTTLGRMAEKTDLMKAPEDLESFEDVNTNAYYAIYVAWAKANAIVNGTSATTFSPNGTITREQMCTIMVRFLRDFLKLDLSSFTADISSFTDAADVSDYAKDAVGICSAAQLISGYPNEDGTVRFSPKSPANRAQIAVILVRVYDNFLAKLLEKPDTGSDDSGSGGGSIGGGIIAPSDPTPVTPSDPIPVDPDPTVHTEEELAAEAQLVSDLKAIVAAYGGTVMQYKLDQADEEVQAFFATLVECVEDALAKHDNNGQFLDEAFIRSEYASQISALRTSYHSMTEEQVKNAQDIAVSFPNIRRVLGYFGYSL